MTKKFFSALAAIALLAVPACDELNGVLNEEIPCTSIVFDEPSFMMTVGETKTLPVTVEPANTTDKLEWSSSDEEIVSITDGVATAKQEGIASITVKAGNQLGGCRIVVRKAEGGEGGEGGGDGKIEVTEIQLNKTEITVVTGLSEQLEVVKLLPENATEKTVVWESDNPNIALVIPQDATVNGVFYKGGRVTGRDPGTTTIRALAGVAKAECKVTVTSGGSVSIESISIDPSPISLAVDEEKILTAVITPSNAKAVEDR